jgi:CDP-diacylglycerol--glycerol-3-phosphate 3-phosphatidyltransferase
VTSAPAAPSQFGPSALATPANALTMGRLVAAPLYALLLAVTGPATWLLFSLWFVLSFSDTLDGRLARRHGATRSGAFLDPLADKFLVLGALFALAGIGAFPWLPVALIAVREVAMSAFRSYAGRQGVSIPARGPAKLKTWLQSAAVGLAVFPPLVHHLAVARWTLWAAVALTLFTGWQYAAAGRKLVRSGSRALA